MVTVLDLISCLRRMIGGLDVAVVSRGRLWLVATALAAAASQNALSQDISGPCSEAVGTFLTTNKLGGNSATSRSLFVLTNGGHVLHFDSDEWRAAADHHAFGNSAGTWRCDRVEDDGTTHNTALTFDFTYPGPRGDKGQVARIVLSGRYIPTVMSLELEGKLAFLPINVDAKEAAKMLINSDSITISLCGTKITLPRPSP